jgi:hypothetical protein
MIFDDIKKKNKEIDSIDLIDTEYGASIKLKFIDGSYSDIIHGQGVANFFSNSTIDEVVKFRIRQRRIKLDKIIKLTK